MDYGAWFLFTLRMEAKSQQGGLYIPDAVGSADRNK